MNDIIPHQLIRILSLIIGLIAIPLINIPIIGQLIIIMAISLTLIWTTNILRIQKVDNQKII
ncbi:MAG: hypothetical protein Q4Q23_06785, partial [Methanobacteriaceae archaeon]|nr:hypothetical protein [Methanobacteriaceae archaeon]